MHFWNMHQEHVNPNTDRVRKSSEPSILTFEKVVSDINLEVEVGDEHPDMKGGVSHFCIILEF